MCVVSMIGEHFAEKWVFPAAPVPVPMITQWVESISRAEFDQLRMDVDEMKVLLKRAVKYDKEHDQEDCGIEEKMELLRKVAAAVGVDLDDVLKPAGEGE